MTIARLIAVSATITTTPVIPTMPIISRL